MHLRASSFLIVVLLTGCRSLSTEQAAAPRATPVAEVSTEPAPESVGASEASAAAAARPEPTTAAQRQSERLAPDAVARVWAHLPEGTELHGVTPMTATADGELEALLVRSSVLGRIEAEVFVLDSDGRLVTRLPRASVDGPGVLRVGAVQLPLAERSALEAIACGELDLRAASSVLRLAGMVAEDELERVAKASWDAFEAERDADVTLLGVCPLDELGAGGVPRTLSSRNPTEFEVTGLLPATLAGWSQDGRRWSGSVRVGVRSPEGETQTLVVGVSGALPR